MTTGMKMVMVLFFIAVFILGGKPARAQLHHVVGGDRGWDTSADIAAWSSGRTFRVGEKIWFSYSVAQESVAELKSKEDYESCDVSKPIRMYTDGINSISLDGEGIRYFSSSNPESCKNGLRLHVEVLPRESPQNPMVTAFDGSASGLAAAPTTPSGSVHLCGSLFGLLVGIGLCYLSL